MARPPTAPPIVIPNCLMVVLHWTHIGGQASNVIHGNLTAAGPINPALAETLFSGFKAHAGTTAWLARVSASVSFSGVSIRDMRAGNNPVYVSTGVAIPGTSVEASLSINAALVVTHNTSQSGRQFRGRSYLAGIANDQLADVRTFTTACGNAGVAFLDGINSVMGTNQVPMVVAQQQLLAGTDSKDRPLAARPAGVVPITSFKIANPRVDTQRRRLGR